MARVPLTLPSALSDLAACVSFFTRLPVPGALHGGERPLARALWAAPLAGVAVGLITALAFAAAVTSGLDPALAALLALGAALLATGCLHEDGLSDVADGFGGGRTAERKLAIMRDSRIGSYGAAALFVSLGLRWASIAELAAPGAVLSALVAAHGASRGLLPLFLAVVPPARADGLGAGVGAVPRSTAFGALALGALSLLPLGPAAALVALALLLAAFALVRRLAIRQIGGQTGDVCGALQQVAEILVLLVATVALA